MNRHQFIEEFKKFFTPISNLHISEEKDDSFTISFITGNRGCLPPQNNVETRSINALLDDLDIPVSYKRVGSGFISCTHCNASIQDSQITEILNRMNNFLQNEETWQRPAFPGMG